MAIQDNQDENQGSKKPGHWGRGGWKQNRLQRKMEELHRMQFGQRGFLRPQILELFEQGPMNGVDIMNRLQQESHGWYRPSPGSIYPLLDQLEKEGLIAKNKDGKFELTSAYAEISGVAGDISSALSSLESTVSYLEDLQRSDAAKLSKAAGRIEKLSKKLDDLTAVLRQGGGQA
jgi:DNA-binding PadR family transcriptional regulator